MSVYYSWPVLLFSFFVFFTSSTLHFFGHPVLALNSQGQSLLSWKATLNGSIGALSNWNSTDETPCHWFGITCDLRNEVVEINLKYMDLFGPVLNNFTSLESLNRLVLSGTNLTGSLPEQVDTLNELLLLDLSDNALSGEISSSGIFHLPKLEKLHLHSNRFEGKIPDDLGNLTSLVELTLYDNQLSGSIPSTIGNLKRLEVIRAGGNKNLGGPLPYEIGNCTNLKLLGLAETSVSGFLPSSLGQLKNLETIALYTTLISGQIPPELGDCTKLMNIYLYENALTGSIPAKLGSLVNLENLLMWQNNLVGVLPPEIGNCNNLQVIDASMNSLTGSIPESFGNLSSLQELQLSANQISGYVPSSLGKCTSLTHIELDNNQLTGVIPSELGNLLNLTILFLWQNHLEGVIPPSLASCRNLQALDLSLNALTGSIPMGLFELQNLNKFLVLSNNLTGEIPPEIGNCSSLIRLRVSNNKITGNVPSEIGKLQNLNFLDLASNRLSGTIPTEISRCKNLTFLDLHSNSITGDLPGDLNNLVNLQYLDVSENLITGTLSPSFGSLTSLTKLILGNNNITGQIPSHLGSCFRLQLLDLSSNSLEGPIPGSIGKIPALEIALNLSCNKLSGEIPQEFTYLDRLGVLDISHNQLSGDIPYLQDLQNLVALNISYNNFSGHLPETSFFLKLPATDLAGNPNLCFSGNKCPSDIKSLARRSKTAKIAMAVLICTACILMLSALYIVLSGKNRDPWAHDSDDVSNEDEDEELRGPWDVTLYQKLDLSISEVAKSLTAANVIGRGRSGVVYRSLISLGPTIAVKRFRLSEKHSSSAFTSEITTLARVRHRNIVRLLGWAGNKKTKLLFYDYIPNGTLGSLLHETNTVDRVDWEIRFKIALGVAEGLAYLHHDCVPPIIHRDVKAHNILLGDRYEPCLADFGLARFVEDQSSTASSTQFAGSYGYFAPEYSTMVRITQKSDVYSYGVVLLEAITGKRPVDPSFPENEQHILQWVRAQLKSEKDPLDVIDPKLQGHPDPLIQEMLQALGIVLLCTSDRPEDRPTMKDVVALLKEIKQDQSDHQGQKPANKSTSRRYEEVEKYSSLLQLRGCTDSNVTITS